MIRDIQIDEMIQPIIDIYNQMELDLIVEIAERFKNYNTVSGSLEWQIKKLNELGALNKSAIKIISKYSGKSEQTIKNMIEQAGMANIDAELLNTAYDNGMIKVDPVKMMQSPTIRATLEHSYKELNKTYRLIQTKAVESTRKAYIQTLNTAYIDVASGTYDYQTAIKKAVRQMAQKGIEGATYKRGDRYVRYSIEAVVRRDTLTAFHQTANRVAYQACQEMGSDYVEISQHLGARVHPTNPIANHAGWQGKVFKIEGSTKEYPNLKASTGYPDDIQGLGGVNCRHRMFAFFPGISVPKSIHYDKAENEKAYRLSQKQRKLERDIRALKKQKTAADAINDKEMSDILNNKLNKKYDEINRFCDANGLKRDYSRELVSEQLVKKNVAKKPNNDIIKPVVKKEVEDVHYIGKIDKDIYKCVTDNISTDDVIITDERINHIKERHPNDFEKYCQYMEDIISAPEYIIEANKQNTALILKAFSDGDEQFKTILRLITSSDNSEFKNSIITFMKINDKEWNRLIKNKKVLYKLE